jgi:hypothetical protein
MPVFPAVDRRDPSVIRDNQVILMLVQQVHDKIEAMDARLTQHMTDETLTLAEEIANLMNKSFPQGDPEGHRAYHEASIKRAEANAEFWSKMRFEISKWGLIGFLGWFIGMVAVSVWKNYFGK